MEFGTHAAAGEINPLLVSLQRLQPPFCAPARTTGLEAGRNQDTDVLGQ
jgi:hypothetical protein